MKRLSNKAKKREIKTTGVGFTPEQIRMLRFEAVRQSVLRGEHVSIGMLVREAVLKVYGRHSEREI